MGHEEHGHGGHEEKPLGLFASPLNKPGHDHGQGHPQENHYANHSDDGSLEHQKTADPNNVPFQNQDCSLHESPAFHRHAEATTAELFYDLFFVANLTTFTANLAINDRDSLSAYVGFFCLLWLTWYQVSLYDVRFSADSLFERCAKAIHFGVMVGFAVIGASWKPGQDIYDFKTYKAFGLILMVSRLTLAAQYGVTLFYTRKYKKTMFPLGLVIAFTLLAAILYGSLIAVFPTLKLDPEYPAEYGVVLPEKTNIYIAWYVIGISETILTVLVSCFMRVISFKGTHMVQRMSLLTLIILGEGIIVICKGISLIVKNEYLFTGPIIGQIIASVLIIYFLYMLYFDRIQEEHFGTIKQQLWSFLHFPLHLTLVLVLQGVSVLILWLQAIRSFFNFGDAIVLVIGDWSNGVYNGDVDAYLIDLNATCYNYVFDFIPKGVDASKEKEALATNLVKLYDNISFNDGTNATAAENAEAAFYGILTSTSKSLFDSLYISLPKKVADKVKTYNIDQLTGKYVDVVELVFLYVYVAGGITLLIMTALGFFSLPASQRKVSSYIRLGFNAAVGIGMCLVSIIKTNEVHEQNYLISAWMIPTLCILLFLCVVANHIRLPFKSKAH
ncbi:hypothetical protein P154DRAFT_487403 [Amniculicola lignicola CBS 123094]|uniref:Low temperature requirement A n=1 Tax=Amniculicola lignicola CBS 123094 TaxID=1392246 RepID=A0A6A5WQ66_9PLEO|nr:hypothetical protein P154DRAFT_487403 [Amniculicola lignicola CBS 123094]